MYMFNSVLNSIPKYRSDMVEDLLIPDITLSPYEWESPEVSLSSTTDSLISEALEEYERRGTVSTASSIPLSRAMTDSEIDYGRYKRYKSLNYSNPWDHLRAANNAFPPGYLTSLYRYPSRDITDEIAARREAEDYHQYYEDLRRRMQRRYDEVRAFEPDDPALVELREAVRDLEMKGGKQEEPKEKGGSKLLSRLLRKNFLK